MAVLGWVTKLWDKLVGSVVKAGVGVARTFLRGAISAAVHMEESLPDIRETMRKVDPGEVYAEWAQQFRATQQTLSKKELLATWPSDLPVNASVITNENFRRARKYRYVFSGQIEDLETSDLTWKMYSVYSDKLMSPDELKRLFEDAYFKDMYNNNIHLNNLVLRAVQQWTSKKSK